jgi:hypothetical protein
VDVILDLNKQNTETQYDMVDFTTNAIMDVTILIPSKTSLFIKGLAFGCHSNILGKGVIGSNY